MKFRLIRLIFFLSFFAFTNNVLAQEDVYVAEVGFNTGGSFYIGDANSLMFNNTQIAYGPFIRYNVDPRFSVKAELGITQITGQYLDPVDLLQKSFTNSIRNLDVCAEYNFFDLEKLDYKLFSKTFSPFIFGGLGYMSYTYDRPDFGIAPFNPTAHYNYIKPIFVFGLGMKVMIAKRININFQWSNRLLITDSGDTMEGLSKLDHGKDGSIPKNGSNIFNNDLLSTMTIGVSFDIWKKQCDCLNINKIEKHKKKKVK